MNCLMFVPYLYERIMRVGLIEAMGYSKKLYQGVAPWAERCKAAHLNAVEGLVVFAPLVLIALHLRVEALAAIQVYFFARLIHYLAYAFAVRYLRTVAFFVILVVSVELVIHIFYVLS